MNKIIRREFGPMLYWHGHSPTMSMKCILGQTKPIDPHMQLYDRPLMAQLLMSTNKGEIQWDPCERKRIFENSNPEFAQFVQSTICLCLKCCTKKLAPFILANPFLVVRLRLVSRRAGEREAV